MIDRIDELESGQFELTSEQYKCTYCSFRSYCDRGREAGEFDEYDSMEDNSPGLMFGDLDDYESIAF